MDDEICSDVENGDSPKSKRKCDIETPVKFKEAPLLAFDKSIKVSHLPPTFMQLSFCAALEKFRLRHAIQGDVPKAITNVVGYSKEERHVYIELINADIADQLCKVKEFIYLKHRLAIEPAMYAIDTPKGSSIIINATPEAPLFSSTAVPGVIEQMQSLSPFLNKNDTNNNNYEGHRKKFAKRNILETVSTATATKVLFENIELPFNEVSFSNFLARCLDRKCKGIQGYIKEFRCAEYSSVNKSIVVEFQSPSVASTVVDQLNYEEYMCDPWHLSLLPGELHSPIACNKTPAPSTKVLFENIEAPFSETSFSIFLSRCLDRKCKGIQKENRSFTCEEYSSAKKSIVVEFQSPSVASTVVDQLNYEEYMCDPWNLSLLPGVLHSSMATNEMPAPSTKVLFENIEAPFSETSFSAFLSRCLDRKCKGIQKENRSFTCEEYSSAKKSIVVEFQSPSVASTVVDQLNYEEYMCDPWNLSLLPGVLHSSMATNEMPAPSTKVLFENIEAPFSETSFSTFLSRCLDRKCKGIQEEDRNFTCEEYSYAKKSIVVEFQTHEVAVMVCDKLQFIEYNLDPLTLTLYEDTKTESVDYSYAGPLGAVVPLDELNEDEIDFSSDEAKPFFHEALLKTRECFQTKFNHETGYIQIQSYLKSKNVVGATKPLIFKARRNLNNAYNGHKKKGNKIWPLYKMCEIIFDKGEIDDAATVKFGDALIPLETAVVAKMLTKGAVFHAAARSDLIEIIKKNHDAYRGGQFRFWDNVKEMMEDMGHNYSADDCRSEFKDMEKTLKDIEVVRKRTGAPNKSYITEWKHYEEMRDFAQMDVAFTPAGTASAGSTCKLEVPQKEGSKQLSTSLKRPLRKGAAMQGILEQMTRSNDLKERLLESHL